MNINKVNQITDFFHTDIKDLEKDFNEKDGEWWQRQGKVNALKIFKEAAIRVPAYKKFLIENCINFEKIKTYQDFQKIPYTDKKNYIDKYPFDELLWDNKLSNNLIINSSSGTTGTPYFWPGSTDKIARGAIVKEFIFKNNFNVDKKSTLLIICFGMGTWIAGSYTFITAQMISMKGYPLTTITPGFNKKEALKILCQLSPKFEQTILAGPPTFIKDLLEEWKKTKESKLVKEIKFDFAAEGFSEDYREYILEMVKSRNSLNDAINIYGSADATLMGFETPMSISLRKIASKNEKLRTELFGENRLPAFYNYIPSLRFFESENDELVLTANLSIPLIRYNIHDHGGIIPSSKIRSTLNDHTQLNNCNLPYIYVFGRGKFTATIYAANIYPENVREVLFDVSVRKFVTGNFMLATKYTDKKDHYLEISIEMAEHVTKSKKLDELITNIFVIKMKRLSTEYNRIYQEYGQKAKPKVILYHYGDQKLFPKDKIKKSS